MIIGYTIAVMYTGLQNIREQKFGEKKAIFSIFEILPQKKINLNHCYQANLLKAYTLQTSVLYRSTCHRQQRAPNQHHTLLQRLFLLLHRKLLNILYFTTLYNSPKKIISSPPPAFNVRHSFNMYRPAQSIDRTETAETHYSVRNKYDQRQQHVTAKLVTSRSVLSKKKAIAKTTKVNKINFDGKSKLNIIIFLSAK
jgi:hypothetical protein